MKITFTLISILLVTAYCAQGQAEEELQKFEWLCATWERLDTKPGQHAFEIWEMKGDRLNGIGYTLQGEDTVFVEHLSIIIRDSELYYGSEVSHNPAAVYFKIQVTGNTSFKSSNPDHDFPKAIDYSLVGEMLTATISGDGKAIPFRFKKRTK